MSDENKADDGYLLNRAIAALRTLGSSQSEGWDVIREFWEELANGRIDQQDAAYWAQEIAERVVMNVMSAGPQDRPRKALAAIGLVAVAGDHRKEREYIQMYEEFRALAETEGRRFALTREEFAEQMLERGDFEGLSVEQTKKAIDYIKSTLRPKK